MKLEQSFTVDAPVERVWEALVDVERVAPCLPGAQITGHDGDTYRGTFSVKIGPATAAYNGVLKMEQLDAQARVAVMSARGTDKRGQGGASATIRSTVVQEDGRAKVDVVTDFTITGRLAGFGRGGMIQDVANRLLRDFAACLEQTVGAVPEGAAEPEAAAAPPAGAVPSGPATAPSRPPEGEAAVASGPAAGMPPADRQPPAPPPVQPAEPLSAFALLRDVVWERLKRLVLALWRRLGRLLGRG